MKNIIKLLENTTKRFPDKVFIGEENAQTSFIEFYNYVKSIGSFLLQCDVFQKPVAVLADKSSACLELALGAVAAGGYYVILDSKSPAERLNKILNILNPEILLVSNNCKERLEELDFDKKIIDYESIKDFPADNDGLAEVDHRQIDTDVLYVLFTSGSTGLPKGVIITHKAVLSYIDWVTNEFEFDENTIFGSQAPFYFSMSVTDVFSSIVCGSTLEIIPKFKFSFPVELIKYMNEKKVNTIYWVPTAIALVANLSTFEFIKPEYLQKVLFAGEVMHTKILNYWINNLPNNILYANLFGPTETTDICTFYKVNRKFDNTEKIPIGTPCSNCGVSIIDENGKEAKHGELYVRGSFLANGYYGDSKKTAEAFVQNPLQNNYPEAVYKTGDLVTMNKYGEIEYISRKDFQIKHLGYRIEPGEIENCLNTCESIKSCVCLYDSEKDLLVAVFEGKKNGDELLAEKANSCLTSYMRPNIYLRIRNMPINSNGKIDRNALFEYYKTNSGN